MEALGSDALRESTPLVPAELVIDQCRSIAGLVFRPAGRLRAQLDLRINGRNKERFHFLRWGSFPRF